MKGLETKKAVPEPDTDPTIIQFVKTQYWPSVFIKDAGVKGEGMYPINMEEMHFVGGLKGRIVAE